MAEMHFSRRRLKGERISHGRDVDDGEALSGGEVPAHPGERRVADEVLPLLLSRGGAPHT